MPMPMSISFTSRPRRAAMLLVLLAVLAPLACAYPPAPHHEVYGVLRDRFGTPVSSADAQIFLEDGSGRSHQGTISLGMAGGTNYVIVIPMDSGRTPDPYHPSAMKQFSPFTIRVVLGGKNHLPMEVTGSILQLGEPAKRTRLDLTLGVDSDGDGLPDEWEETLASLLGGQLGIGDIHPGDDSDGDGMTNLQEYLAGTYPWDPNDRLALNIIELRNGRAVLEFMAIDGREYIIHASTDLKNWAPVNFRIPDRDEPTVSRSRFIARVFEPRIEVEAAPPAVPGRQYFSLQAR